MSTKGLKISYAAYKKAFEKAQKQGLIRPNERMLSEGVYNFRYKSLINENMDSRNMINIYDAEGTVLKTIKPANTIPLIVIEGQRNIGSAQVKIIASKFKSSINQYGDFATLIANISLDKKPNFVYEEDGNTVKLIHYFHNQFNNQDTADILIFERNRIDSIAAALAQLPKPNMYAILIDLGIIDKKGADHYEGY